MSITIDTIIDHLKHCVEQRIPIGPDVWLDGAQKMTVLLGEESDRLFDLQHEVNLLRTQQMERGASAAKAKIYAESMPEYKEMQKQKARIERIQEMIRIAKLQARMKVEEMRNYG
jgi:hypothetical protein